jgi:hypothetical protein
MARRGDGCWSECADLTCSLQTYDSSFLRLIAALSTPVTQRVNATQIVHPTPRSKRPDFAQPLQVKQGVCRSEGHAVVTANVDRQAALLKKPLKHSKSLVFAGGRKSLTGEEKTASVIGDGQWIAVLMIPQQELALVISAPQLIGFLA